MPGSKDEIREYVVTRAAEANGHGFFRRPLVGFASAADPLFEEIPRLTWDQHLLPRDILPEAATVVSFFIPFSRELVRGNQGPGPVSADWGRAYVATNAFINRLCGEFIQKAEASGHRAATVPATHGFDKAILKAAWSHRSSALVAGLGRFGLNRMLMGPSGCAGRYGTLFISRQQEPDPRPMEDLCLYFQSGKCQACVKVCPAGALSPEGFDRFKCYAHVSEIHKELNQIPDLAGQSLEICGKCVVSCPRAIIEP